MPRTLVTGGAGFIGSNLVDALLDEGHEVIVVDDLSTGREENLDSARERGAVLHVMDIRDGTTLARLMGELRPETVFHLAAQVDVRKSIERPAWDARINVEGTVNVLEASRQAGVARVVNTSTGGAIYGAVEPIPTPEDADTRPIAAYGQSKHCAEGYCTWYARLYEMAIVTLRLGNVYGPRQDPLGEAGVIAIFCGRLAARERPTVYGDGTQTRDYIYVADVVEAQIAAANHAGASGALNIGTGRETTVLELLDAMRDAAGLGPQDDFFEPEFAPPRTGELDRSCLDVTRAHRELGWSARVGIAEGMRRTVAATVR
jgi:UDP-glucose 4-epimerase